MDRKANKKEDKSFTSEYCAVNQKQKTGLKNTKNKKKKIMILNSSIEN